MQEIRDYIFGMLNYQYTTWLFRLREHKRKWEPIEVGPMEKMESLVKQWAGGLESYHIMGGIKYDTPIESAPEAPPPRVYEKILGAITPTSHIRVFGEEPSVITYSTWGIWYDEPNWRLIGVGLPKLEDLEKLRLRGKFDRIRVCKYDSRLKCLESCEMILWDREGNRLN